MYEGLARNGSRVFPKWLHCVGELYGWGAAFDSIFVEKGVTAYAHTQAYQKGRALTLNVEPATLWDEQRFLPQLRQLSNEFRRLELVLEISEGQEITPGPGDDSSSRPLSFAGTIEQYRLRLDRSTYVPPLACDDFGVAHTSLIRVIKLRPSLIKVDQDVCLLERGEAETVLVVARLLELHGPDKWRPPQRVVEGVPDDDEKLRSELLRLAFKHGYHYAQGYFFGKAQPRPITELRREVQDEVMRLFEGAPQLACSISLP